MSATLSVSGGRLRDCAEVASEMAKIGVACDVTATVTVPESGVPEPGCRVRMTKWTPEAWPALRARFGFGCAHLSYEGCVADVS